MKNDDNKGPATTAVATVPDPTKPAEPQSLAAKQGLSMDKNGNLDMPSLGYVLASSGFFPDIQKASQGIVKMMLGKELGIPPITAVIGIHILKDKDGRVSVMVGSHIKAGKIKASPNYDYDVKESTAERCTLIPKVRNLDTGMWEKKEPVTFALEQAKRMKLGGYGKDGKDAFNPYGNWAKAPEDMLFNRALGRMEKQHFPDLTTVPTYTPDELGFRETNGEPVLVESNLVRDDDGTQVPQVQQQTPEAEMAEANKKLRVKASAAQIAKLQSIAKRFKWEEGQVFQMMVWEDALLIAPTTAQELVDANQWKQLTEQIAGDDALFDKMRMKLELGPEAYLDAHHNPPEPEQGKLV